MTNQSKPRGRPPLELERIVNEALACIDEDGVDSFSFRGLADRLSSSTSTLYRHVKDKAELLEFVTERLLSEVPLPASCEQEQWDDVCESTMNALFGTLVRHPGATGLLAQHFPAGRYAAAIRERVLGALLQGGFNPETAASAVAVLARYTVGFAIQSSLAPTSEAQFGSRTHTAEPELTYPFTASVGHLLPKTLAEEFHFGLLLLVQGLRSKVEG